MIVSRGTSCLDQLLDSLVLGPACCCLFISPKEESTFLHIHIPLVEVRERWSSRDMARPLRTTYTLDCLIGTMIDQIPNTIFMTTSRCLGQCRPAIFVDMIHASFRLNQRAHHRERALGSSFHELLALLVLFRSHRTHAPLTKPMPLNYETLLQGYHHYHRKYESS